MSGKTTRQLDNRQSSTQNDSAKGKLEITVMSFGYKQGPPPHANILFDVRFLKNPYWVEELRPLTGLDLPVQEYVLGQALAKDFLEMLVELLGKVLPKMAELEVEQFVIAFGCTGGQHRSTTLVEALGKLLEERYSSYKIRKVHRELDRHDQFPDSSDTDGSGKGAGK